MVGKTATDYLDYVHKCNVKSIQDTKTVGIPADQQFWEAAYAYDPTGDGSAGPSQLLKMIGSGRMKPLVLGKLYGIYTLKLLPAIGALRVFDPDFDCHLEFAATDSAAILYPGESF